ncbi:XRE family transcriptional regulator [Ktedonospora formicarum]|nr:XRE family transcriptional regulator [Ktedonospora formicarum]
MNQSLRSEREKHGWSRAYVAEQLDLADPKTLGRWERGVSSPSAQFVRKLCLLFEKSKEELGLAPIEKQSACINARHSLFWNVPYRRNPFFTGRQELLTHISTILHTHNEMTSISALALGGMGGIGKTQTVVEYVYRFRNVYRLIIWIQADTHESLVTDCKRIVNALHLRQHEQESVCDTLKQWLRNQDEWLVILDNVVNLDVINKVIPVEATGHILLTTQRSSLGEVAQYILLHGFTPEEGALFLLRRIQGRASTRKWCAREIKAAHTLSWLVSGLPLALDQAGTYIEEIGCQITRYLAMYQQYPAMLLHRRGESRLDHPDSVGTMLTLICDELEKSSPATREILRFCAFLHPDTLPEELVLESLTHISRGNANSPLLYEEALSILRRSSLIQVCPETQMLTVHPLVQIIVKASMDPQEQRRWVETIVHILSHFFLDTQVSKRASFYQRYSLQLQACMVLITLWNITSPITRQLRECINEHFSGPMQLIEPESTHHLGYMLPGHMEQNTHEQDDDCPCFRPPDSFECKNGSTWSIGQGVSPLSSLESAKRTGETGAS